MSAKGKLITLVKRHNRLVKRITENNNVPEHNKIERCALEWAILELSETYEFVPNLYKVKWENENRNSVTTEAGAV